MDTFVVLGPPRTGTSLVAGMLHRSGITMGDVLNPPAEPNTGGFYEDLELVAINGFVLRQAGGDWAHPPRAEAVAVLGEVWIPRIAEVLRRKRQQAGEAGCGAWGFKDQRVCLLLPLYVDVLREMRARVIVTHRNPLHAAQSLVRAWPDAVNGLDGALALVQDYVARIEDFVADWPTELPLLRVSFERFFEDEAGQMGALERFTGRGLVGGVDGELRHF